MQSANNYISIMLIIQFVLTSLETNVLRLTLDPRNLHNEDHPTRLIIQ